MQQTQSVCMVVWRNSFQLLLDFCWCDLFLDNPFGDYDYSLENLSEFCTYYKIQLSGDLDSLLSWKNSKKYQFLPFWKSFYLAFPDLALPIILYIIALTMPPTKQPVPKIQCKPIMLLAALALRSSGQCIWFSFPLFYPTNNTERVSEPWKPNDIGIWTQFFQVLVQHTKHCPVLVLAKATALLVKMIPSENN